MTDPTPAPAASVTDPKITLGPENIQTDSERPYLSPSKGPWGPVDWVALEPSEAVDTLGRVTWHCSEPGGGPDVGLSFGLGDGRILWVGEITRETHAEQGASLSDNDSGWWIILYNPEAVVIAKCVDAEVAREMFDAMVAAWNRRPTPPQQDRLAEALQGLREALNDVTRNALAVGMNGIAAGIYTAWDTFDKAAALAPGDGGDGWRDIGTAPVANDQDDTPVWVFGGLYTAPTLVLPDGGWWRRYPDLRGTPKYWMPAHIPAPPATAQPDGGVL